MSETGRQTALQLWLSNDVQEIADIAADVDAFCAAHNLAPEIAQAVNLSLDELLTNTISYGFADDKSHRIGVTIELDGGIITVQLTDDGLPFDPFSAPDPDIDAALEDRPVGGLGVFLVRQLMDEVDYRRAGGRNIVTIRKQIADASNAEA